MLAASTDRRVSVRSEALHRQFSPSASYDYLDMRNRSQEAIDAWVQTPWFYHDVIVVGNECGHYVGIDGWFSCSISLVALLTFSWMQYFCFDDDDPPWGRSGSLAAARRSFVVLSLSGLSRWKSSVEIPKELGLDVFQYGTRGEETYVRRLAALDPSLVASRVCRIDIDDGTLYFVKLQLCVDFHYLDNGSSHYCSNFVRNVR